MRKVPFFRPSISEREIAEVVATLKSGWLTTGPKAREFEEKFAVYAGKAYAVAVNSCTAALHLALEAVGLTSADAVLVPTMTFAATAEVVRYFGANPILVDCNEADSNIDVADAEIRLRAAQRRGERVRAIIPVHYGGQVADAAAIRRLASAYEVKVIDDAAHCCPAYYRDRLTDPWKPVGADSEIACYSFYANKPLTTAEGGMACTDREDYAARMRIMSLHGISKDAWKRFRADGSHHYEIVAPGYKYNLTDIAAGIGLQQLDRADALHRRRSELARLYRERLNDLEEIMVPPVDPNRIHSWHLFTIRCRLNRLNVDRDTIICRLKEMGVGTSVHYLPLHMHPYYRETYNYDEQDFPVAAGIYHETITLPLYPSMEEADVEYVADCLSQILADSKRPRVSGMHLAVAEPASVTAEKV